MHIIHLSMYVPVGLHVLSSVPSSLASTWTIHTQTFNLTEIKGKEAA